MAETLLKSKLISEGETFAYLVSTKNDKNDILFFATPNKSTMVVPNGNFDHICIPIDLHLPFELVKEAIRE